MGSGFKGKRSPHKITSADNNCTTGCSSQCIKSLLNFHILVPNLDFLFIQKWLICISLLSNTSVFLYTTQEHTRIFLKIIYALFWHLNRIIFFHSPIALFCYTYTKRPHLIQRKWNFQFSKCFSIISPEIIFLSLTFSFSKNVSLLLGLCFFPFFVLFIMTLLTLNCQRNKCPNVPYRAESLRPKSLCRISLKLCLKTDDI